MSAPFVGRDEELRALGALVSGARRAGAPTAALVLGEPGSGKSRLLREALLAAEHQRTVVLVGFEPMESIPLAAAGPLLRRLATIPEHGPRLAALTFGASAIGAQATLAVFEVAHRALTAFGPLALWIDDLQWLDKQSLALVHYLVNAAESTRSPLAVVAASRPSKAATSFGDGITRLLPEARHLSFEMRGLRMSDGIALARAVDAGLDDAAAELLWRRAAGSPFWLETLARGRGPTDVVDLLTDRLRALSADAASLLNLLAIAARPIDAGDVAAIVRWPAERLGQASHDLVGRGLAVEGPGGVGLAHDLIRETAARVMPATSRHKLHARLAEQLERTAGDDLHALAEALDHRAAAGLPTVDLAIRLLGSPRRRLLSIDGLLRIASISDAAGVGSSAQLTLDRGVGKLAGILGEQALSMRLWDRVAVHDPDPNGKQEAAWEAALAAFRLGRNAEAHAYLDRALAAAEPGPEVVARIDALRAEICLWLDHDAPAGAAAARRALAAGREMIAVAGGLDRLPAASRYAHLSALLASIGAAMQEERAEDGTPLTSEAVSVARAIDEESLVEALLRGGFALSPLGAARETERLYREAWDVAHSAVLPFAMIDAGIGLARALRDLGRLAEARTVALETVELEARLGSPPGRWGNAVATLHLAELSLGDAAGLTGLRSDARNHPNPHFRLALHQQLAIWLARLAGTGDIPEIEAELDAATADGDLAGCPRCSGELLVVSAEALARIGRIEAARRKVAEWEARPVAEYPMRQIWRLRAAASIAKAEGDAERAAANLADLADKLEEVGLLDELVWVHLDRGGLGKESDRPRSVAEYTAAAALSERIGATTRSRIAAQALRRLGVRAWRRNAARDRGDGLGPLSPREREVAVLVAAGSSNREIADALVLSSRTVDRHLTNILAKVGARNRTELAALVHAGLVRGSADD